MWPWRRVGLWVKTEPGVRCDEEAVFLMAVQLERLAVYPSLHVQSSQNSCVCGGLKNESPPVFRVRLSPNITAASWGFAASLKSHATCNLSVSAQRTGCLLAVLHLIIDSARFCVTAWLRTDLHFLFSQCEGLSFYKALKQKCSSRGASLISSCFITAGERVE